MSTRRCAGSVIGAVTPKNRAPRWPMIVRPVGSVPNENSPGVFRISSKYDGAGFALTSDDPAPSALPPYPTAGLAAGLADIDEVDRARGAADRRVIDVRAAFRFRGDSDPFDPVAGHIPGARNAPYADNLRADVTFKSADELRALFAGVLDGISPAQTIVHCGSGVTACHTLLAMERAGLSGARLYVGPWSEWCRRPERPRAGLNDVTGYWHCWTHDSQSVP